MYISASTSEKVNVNSELEVLAPSLAVLDPLYGQIDPTAASTGWLFKSLLDQDLELSDNPEAQSAD